MKGYSVDVFENISQMALSLCNVNFYASKEIKDKESTVVLKKRDSLPQTEDNLQLRTRSA